MRLLRLVVLFALVASGGCTSLRYYGHVAHGQIALLAKREPLTRVIADPHTEASLRERLREAQAARAFASSHLQLPDNRSYTSYVQLDRPYVTWSVFAAPELSVDPVTHCFPFAGCVAYLGYFDRAHAERAAKELGSQGNDTVVRGVAAFSTLGWFADPIVSSMLRGDEDSLDETMFHELTHQKLYVRDDSAFNESYASFVAEQGIREWRAARGLPPPDEGDREHDDAFTQGVLDLRERLRAIYASARTDAEKRAAKKAEIEGLRAHYAELRAGEWKDDRRYDSWVAAPINNASLVPFGLYDRWVGAFAELFRRDGGDWNAFHASVHALARLPVAERERRLVELLPTRPVEHNRD
jgi:predicted aminopeptidase